MTHILFLNSGLCLVSYVTRIKNRTNQLLKRKPYPLGAFNCFDTFKCLMKVFLGAKMKVVFVFSVVIFYDLKKNTSTIERMTVIILSRVHKYVEFDNISFCLPTIYQLLGACHCE